MDYLVFWEVLDIFDLILLTEIGNINEKLIEEVFDNYSLCYNKSTSKKGGAGILIRDDKFDEIVINESKVKLNCNCSNCEVESVFVDLKSNNIVLTVGSIYRHPSGNLTHFNESFNNCLKIFNTNNMLLIESNFNIEAREDLKLSTFGHLSVHLQRIPVKLQIYQP